MHARGEQHDGRVGDAGRGDRAQRVEDRLHVAGDRLHLLLQEQAGEHPGERLPVLHHVRDPGRDAQVVLQDPHDPVRAADQVDAGQVHPDPGGRADAGGRAGEVRAGDDERVRHDAVGEHLAFPVHVGEERLQRAHPLHHAGLDVVPLPLGDEPGDQVQREDPLPAGGGERDALLQEAARPDRAALGQVGGGEQLERLVQRLGVRVRHAVGVDHLVEGRTAILGEHPVHAPLFTQAVLRRLCETFR